MKFFSKAKSAIQFVILLISNRIKYDLNLNEMRLAVDLYRSLYKEDSKDLTAARTDAKKILKMIRPIRSPLKIQRVGPKGDSGYMVAELPKYDFVLSGGAGKNIDLEMEYAKAGAHVHICDPFVKKLPINHSLVFHHKILLSDLSENKFKGSSSWTLQQFIDVVGASNSQSNLLKLDIEGSELFLLGNNPINLNIFDQIIIEVHNLNYLTNENMRLKFRILFKNLLQSHHIIHLNCNNNGLIINFGDVFIPQVIELTLLHKKYFNSKPVKLYRMNDNSQNNINRLKLPNIFRLNNIK